MMNTEPLRMPGATLVTRLKVYDTPALDGQIGGTPHIHYLCTEMYFVLSGSGAVELIDGNGFSTVDLMPYTALIFSPGTIHRLINPNGDLELLVIMQNSGLPERGDNVVSFAEQWLCDDDHYAEAMHVTTLEDAYRRRDRGVEGFLQIKQAFERDRAFGQAALRRFYELGAARTAIRRAEWEQIIRQGAATEASRSVESLDSLKNGTVDFLFSAQHYTINAGDYNKLGFCGHLNRYFDPATLSLEGLIQA